MFTLRATRKLLALMVAKPESAPSPPTTVLGDWYANVTTRGLILCVSEKTLLPVVLPGERLRALARELPRALGAVLDSLGVDKTAIERERFAMAQSAVSTTASRRIVGFLNEFGVMMEAGRDDHRSPLEVALDLAHTPCNASSSKLVTWPDHATRAAFGV
ncbi:MAG: DUF6933 domain-containing protein [Myxococcaceae bacterium]